MGQRIAHHTRMAITTVLHVDTMADATSTATVCLIGMTGGPVIRIAISPLLFMHRMEVETVTPAFFHRAKERVSFCVQGFVIQQYVALVPTHCQVAKELRRSRTCH